MDAINRSDITKEARKYIDTPFQHQGRLLGAGVDCVGVIACVAKALGLSDHDVASYPRYPDGSELIPELEQELIEVPIEDLQEGDVLVFWMDRNTKSPQHLAWKTDLGMIHTYQSIGKVSEHGLTNKWMRRLCRVFRFKEMV